MPLFAGKTPAERNKTIAALALGLIAVIFVGRMLFSGPSTTKTTSTTTKRTNTVRTTTTNGAAQNVSDSPDDALQVLQPVRWSQQTVGAVPEAGRNIFAFYIPPTPTPTPIATPPTPTPTPPPPLTLSSLAPNNVFAQTDTFTLSVTGDKFTPQVRVFVDSQEVPTTFGNAQQLTAQVPAVLIAAPGTRQVLVRTPDGQLYSNPLTFNVADPPKPQFTYIGLLGGSHYNDRAMIKAPTNGGTISVQRGETSFQANEVATVQRGDIVAGRFRVTSISERSLDFVDTQLKVKHTLPYVEQRPGSNGARPYVPQPSTDDDDAEP